MILGVDPGRAKAGYALIDALGGVVETGVQPIAGLYECLRSLVAAHPVAALAIGGGTNATTIAGRLNQLGLPTYLVDERETSRLARELYFAEHPPRGWRRLVPVGLQLPPRPIDDYAAILIARRFLAKGLEHRGPKYKTPPQRFDR